MAVSALNDAPSEVSRSSLTAGLTAGSIMFEGEAGVLARRLAEVARALVGVAVTATH